MIGDGRTVTGLSLAEWRQSAPILKIARRRGFLVPALDIIADAPAVPALINWGSWKVLCPDPSCLGGCEDVWREQPQLFCMKCGNRAADGHWLRVALPENRAEIEAELIAIPDQRARNWRPPELAA
ncbi:MAG: hypothetical protein AB7P40_28355 [Chloroflexota bacterium]